MVIGTYLVFLYLEYATMRKLGLKGWEFFVPGYNIWKLAELVGGNGKKCLLLLIGVIPVVGWIFDAILIIIWAIKYSKMLAEQYGKKAVWVFFLNVIYLAPSVFKDAPNCDDPINQAVTKLFKLESKAEAAEQF